MMVRKNAHEIIDTTANREMCKLRALEEPGEAKNAASFLCADLNANWRRITGANL